MNVQTADVNAVVDRALRIVRHQFELTGVQLQENLAQDLPRVQCDPAQMEQVVLALVMNALDAMPKGGNLWVTTGLIENAAGYEICVRDDGTGIPPEILTQIFEPFLTTKETGRGVGLGLAISRSILERHRGNIEVQSEVGRGTTFFVTLPWEAEEEAGRAGAASPENEIATTAGRR